jgi:hypothetical protein
MRGAGLLLDARSRSQHRARLHRAADLSARLFFRGPTIGIAAGIRLLTGLSAWLTPSVNRSPRMRLSNRDSRAFHSPARFPHFNRAATGITGQGRKDPPLHLAFRGSFLIARGAWRTDKAGQVSMNRIQFGTELHRWQNSELPNRKSRRDLCAMSVVARSLLLRGHAGESRGFWLPSSPSPGGGRAHRGRIRSAGGMPA